MLDFEFEKRALELAPKGGVGGVPLIRLANSDEGF